MSSVELQLPETQCPVCLKVLSSKAYLQTHLFQNKKKCTPPAGHVPPMIDYDTKTITWPPVAKVTKVTKTVKVNKSETATKPVKVSKSKMEIPSPQAEITTKTKGIKTAQVAKSTASAMNTVPKPKSVSQTVLAEMGVLNPSLKPKTKKLVPKKAVEVDVNTSLPESVQKKKVKKSPCYLPALVGTVGLAEQGLRNIQTISIKPKVEIQRAPKNANQEQSKTIETTNTVTNNYTIAVDTNGNVVDLPHMKTDNDILKDNPILMDQVKKVIKNLNLGNKTGEPNYRLPPEIEKFQRAVDRSLEEFGDVQKIIRAGVKHAMESVDTIVSINPDEDSCIQIERIPIPENLRETTDRDLSFIEILYRGIYHLMSHIIAHKFFFFESTRSKKAYDDCNRLMKYRKLIQVSHLVLKKRLDHIDLEKVKNPELIHELISNHETYYKNFKSKHIPNTNQIDSSFGFKHQSTGKLTSIEAQSLSTFYESISQMMILYQTRKIVNPASSTLIEEDHAKFIESEVKRRPDTRYVDLDRLSTDHQAFPDYDFEIVSRDFCSHLIKVDMGNFPRGPNHPATKMVSVYYKRIYADGTCEAPLTEAEYERFKDIY
jgi:hypothetical protein